MLSPRSQLDNSVTFPLRNKMSGSQLAIDWITIYIINSLSAHKISTETIAIV